MTRHRAIIRDLGGYVELASQLGLHEEAVKSWAREDRGIPARYWHRVAELAGVTPEYLRRTSPKPHAPIRRPNGR
jgi:YdaS antitoxin of YdaST toxin-antitoxin system